MAREITKESEQAADRLHAAAIHLLRRLRREDAGSGLNSSRLSALSVVVFGGPITLGDLAGAEQVRPPTMTRMVNALEDQGLVRKRRNEKDGRSLLLEATPAGKRLLMEGRGRRVNRLAREIEALPPAKRKMLLRAAEIVDEVVRGVQAQA